MKLKQFIFNPFQENTYILFSENNGNALVIDPGCVTIQEENELKKFIDENKLKITKVLNTHLHLDHCVGNAFFKEEYNIDALACQEDAFLIEKHKDNAKDFGFELIRPFVAPKNFLKQGDTFKFENYEFKTIQTPGHSPGGLVFYCADLKIAFTGDTLFAGSIGRSDFPGGDLNDLLQNIKTKLLVLEDDTTILPGHGPSSSIKEEKLSNPYIH